MEALVYTFLLVGTLGIIFLGALTASVISLKIRRKSAESIAISIQFCLAMAKIG
jgi:hypothetical protein